MALELAGVAACTLLGVRLLWRVVRGLGPDAAWWCLPAALLGWLTADLVSGIAHWLCDRYGSERTPLLGSALIRSFREHHADPLAMTRHGFLELCGNNALVMVPVLAAAAQRELPLARGAPAGLALDVCVLVFGLAIFATNAIHRWAHLSDAPRPVAWLQRHRVLLSPAEHARHHVGAHDRAYCVTSGWCNAPLDRLRLFRRLERGLARVGLYPAGGGTGVA